MTKQRYALFCHKGKKHSKIYSHQEDSAHLGHLHCLSESVVTQHGVPAIKTQCKEIEKVCFKNICLGKRSKKIKNMIFSKEGYWDSYINYI